MTNVKGLIKDSAGDPLDGRLVVTLNQLLIDNSTTPPSAHLNEPKTFTITNGDLDIDLLESETQQISYNFDFQLERPILDNDGNPTGDNEWVRFYSLDAIVPNQAEVDFVGLTPTNFSPDQLDTGVFAVAKVIANNEIYRNNLQFRLNYTGDYSASTIYKRDDVVVYDGSSFVYTNSQNTSGNAPPPYPNTSNSYWELVGLRGNTGTGTTGNDDAYGSSWDGQTDAPSRNTVYDKVETLAPINSPALTGSPTVPQPSAGDNSTLIPNTAWVTNEFAPLDSPALTGTPTAPNPNSGDNSQQLATTYWAQNEFSIPASPQRTEGRLSAIAAPTSFYYGNDSTTTQSLYFYPYRGDKISLYNGSNWELLTIPSSGVIFDCTTVTGGNVFDIFAFIDSGSVALEAVDWSSTTSRGIGLDNQDGVPVKNGNPTRKYLGCVYINSSNQISVVRYAFDSSSKIWINNFYNRIPIRIESQGGSGTYSLTASSGNWEEVPNLQCEYISEDVSTLTDARILVPTYHKLDAVSNVRVADDGGDSSIGINLGFYFNQTSDLYKGSTQIVISGDNLYRTLNYFETIDSVGYSSFSIAHKTTWSSSTPDRNIRYAGTKIILDMEY